MKNLLLFILIASAIISVKSQEINTLRTTNWNTLRKSGFFESLNTDILNAPGNHLFYWGLNIGHTSNISTTSPYHYNGQILFGMNVDPTAIPQVYIRSANKQGEGLWAKVLHDKGTQTINGDLQIGAIVPNKIMQFGNRLHLGGTDGSTDAIWMATR